MCNFLKKGKKESNFKIISWIVHLNENHLHILEKYSNKDIMLIFIMQTFSYHAQGCLRPAMLLLSNKMIL